MGSLLGNREDMSDPSHFGPRTFISYAWSSPTHEAWVLALASRLREDGVDVILDKWDLKPGHDSIAFMESMVTDPTVSKVLMVCDRVYAEKADARTGGVGLESQIISPEIYASSTQDKFAAVITEVDEGNKAYLPTYYKGRIYFDFRSGDAYEDSYEQLLRWLVDRPQYVKPKLGSVPDAILSASPAATGTQSKARRAEDAIRQSSAAAVPYIRDYGDALLPEINALTPALVSGMPSDDAVLTAVESLRPYARQFLELVSVTARFNFEPRVWDALLTVLERMGRLMWRDAELMSWHPHQFDCHKIIVHDVFVSAVAIGLDEGRFDLAEAILAKPWLLQPADGSNRASTSDFTAFNQYIESLEHRKNRLKLNRISLQADILHDSHRSGAVPSFESVMQADFFDISSLSGAINRVPMVPIVACLCY